MQQSMRTSVLWLAGLGVAVVAAVTLGTWNKHAANPERVFWDTVAQGLRTSSVTIGAAQDAGGTNVHQLLQYSLGAENINHTLTTLNQSGTTVKNEAIGTPTADYTRYVSVKTDQKGADGKPLNLSKIIGVWAKNDTNNTGAGQLFTQAVMGTSLPLGGVAIPIANLSPALRTDMITEMRNDNIYQVNFKDVKKKTVNGRLQYTYDVTVQPVLYAGMMKNFAKSMGLHALDQLDPNSFSGQAGLKLRLVVDARAKHLMSAELPDSHVNQTYNSYDVPVSISVPKTTVTVTELQKRLGEIR
jgi:hypothetical protein